MTTFKIVKSLIVSIILLIIGILVIKYGSHVGTGLGIIFVAVYHIFKSTSQLDKLNKMN